METSSADEIRRRMEALRSGGEGTNEDVIVLGDITPITERGEEKCDANADDPSVFGVPHVCAHVRTDYEEYTALGHDGQTVLADGGNLVEDLATAGEGPDESIPPTKPGLRARHKVIMALGLSLLAAGGYMAWYLAYAVANEKAPAVVPGASMPAPPSHLPITPVRVVAPVAVQQPISSSGRSIAPEGESQTAQVAYKSGLAGKSVQKPKAHVVMAKKDTPAEQAPMAKTAMSSPIRKKRLQAKNPTVVPSARQRIQAENVEMNAAFSSAGWERAEFTGIGVVSVKGCADATIVKVADSGLSAAMPLLAAKSRSHFACAGSHCFVLPNKVLSTN